jgi:hypothetical protein
VRILAQTSIQLRVLFVSTVLVAWLECPAAGSELETRFKREAPQKWTDYVEKASRLKGFVKFKRVDRRNGKTLEAQTTEINLSPPYSKVINTRPDEKVRLDVSNLQYSFRLEKESTNSPWVIGQVQNKPPSVGTVGGGPLASQGTDIMPLRYACRGMILMATWLPRMLEEPGFAVKDITGVDDSEGTLARLNFSYDPKQIANNPIRDGSVVLLPDKFWLIKTANVNALWPQSSEHGSIQISNEYKTGSEGLPILSKQVMRVTAKSSSGGESIDHDWIWDYELSENSESVKPEDFTLTAYGFAEPGMTEDVKSRARFYITLVVVIGLAIALLIKNRSKLLPGRALASATE